MIWAIAVLFIMVIVLFILMSSAEESIKDTNRVIENLRNELTYKILLPEILELGTFLGKGHVFLNGSSAWFHDGSGRYDGDLNTVKLSEVKERLAAFKLEAEIALLRKCCAEKGKK